MLFKLALRKNYGFIALGLVAPCSELLRKHDFRGMARQRFHTSIALLVHAQGKVKFAWPSQRDIEIGRDENVHGFLRQLIINFQRAGARSQGETLSACVHAQATVRADAHLASAKKLERSRRDSRRQLRAGDHVHP